MNELRLVLFIIGALVLIALLAHGVWTVRKNSGQPKHRYYDDSVQPGEELPVKAEGFDEFGVGEVRVLKQGVPKPNHKMAQPGLTRPNIANSAVAKPEQDAELIYTDKAEPELNFNALADDEQVSGEFNQADFEHSSTQSEQAAAVDAATTVEPSEVLILYVLLAENKEIKGEELLSSLLTLGFKYGDMDIFHRHTDSSGSGAVLFSLANMFNPGTFDLDNMEKLNTRGVSLFMTLPGPGDALQNFNLMHNAAKKLASEFSGQVLDGQRSVLTGQTVRHYVDKIRECQRQKLIHG